MHGELTTTATADACRELAASGATGALGIVHDRGVGEIVFERGRVVAATSPAPGARIGDRLVNAGLLDPDALDEMLQGQADRPDARRPRLGRLLVDAGLTTPDAVRLVVQEQVIDAVFELTRWEGGRFEFVEQPAQDAPEVPLSVPVDQLLVEVARRRDEWAALSREIPDLDAVPRFREGSNASAASLEPDEFAVLASVDGHRSVRELAEDLGYGEFEAARVIYALVLLGLVEVVRPVDEIGAALDDALAFTPGPDAPPPHRPETPPRHAGTSDHATEPGASPAAAARSPEPEPSRGAEGVGDRLDRWAVELEGHIVPPDEPPPSSATDEPAAANTGADADTGPDADVEEADDHGLAAFAELRAFTNGGNDPEPAPTADAGGDGPATSGPLPSGPSTAASSTPGTPGPPGPRSEQAPSASSPPGDPEAAESGGDRPGGGEQPRVEHRSGRPMAEGDVSEFLRELSRLALEDDDGAEGDAPAPDGPPPPGATPPPPGATPPTAPPTGKPATPSRKEPKRKRRLFGRG